MILKLFKFIKKLLFIIVFIAVSLLIVYIGAYFFLKSENKYLENATVISSKEEERLVQMKDGTSAKVTIYNIKAALNDKSLVQIDLAPKLEYKESICVKHDPEKGKYYFFSTGKCRN